MDSKSVWIINQYTGSPSHGMEYRHYYIAKALIKKGYKVNIISGSYSHLFTHQPLISSNFTFEQIEGINYCWVKIPRYNRSVSMGRIWNMLMFMFKLIRFPFSQLEKPSLIIVSSPSLFPIVIAKRWSKKLGAQLIFEIRDIWPLTLQELGNLSSYHPLILLMRWFEKYGYAKADKVASLLPNAKEYMIKSGMQSSKFVYVPNGIDLSEINANEKLDANIASLLPPKNKFIVGFTGTLNISNAIDTLIEVAVLLKKKTQIHFVIVGSGDYGKELQKMSLGLENVTFIPAIRKAQIQSMLSCFDVLYVGVKKKEIYKWGVSLNKLFDYMYAQKPIVYAVNSGNKPVEEANCGLAVDAENPQASAQAILKLYNMPEAERIKMGKNGRAFVLQHHTYDQIAQKLVESL